MVARAASVFAGSPAGFLRRDGPQPEDARSSARGRARRVARSAGRSGKPGRPPGSKKRCPSAPRGATHHPIRAGRTRLASATASGVFARAARVRDLLGEDMDARAGGERRRQRAAGLHRRRLAAHQWAANSRENRLTPWSNEPSRHARRMHLPAREERGTVWAPNAAASRERALHRPVHGQGYSLEHTPRHLADC